MLTCHVLTKSYTMIKLQKKIALPDKVPTPMTNTSTMASSVMTGPWMDIPWAMFLWTSSWLLELRAKRAMAQALVRSISIRKNGRASLQIN